VKRKTRFARVDLFLEALDDICRLRLAVVDRLSFEVVIASDGPRENDREKQRRADWESGSHWRDDSKEG
jgi:hypothetical protein